ncbi:MAG: acetyl-CoA carboxylase, carboxyltransferase subunit beta [bacterium]|nr:acetyl-CoA carboxylase, carboxyltransferase subunit beta [bacterium]
MSWFKRSKKSLKATAPKKNMPDGLWQKCQYCGEILYIKELEKALWVCSKCGYHFMIGTDQYIEILCDSGTFEETHTGIRSVDPLEFKDVKKYSDRLKQSMSKTGREDAVITGFAKLSGRDVVIAIMDFSFMGGSMGSVVGEKIARAMNDATKYRRPLIIVSRSGGARMQESILSLMQMAKTAAMLAKMSEERIPYISVLTNPTTGGVTASYGSLGDVIIAEPRALIGFAGPRVIKQTIGQELPDGFQRSEFLLEHGMIDMICPRDGLRDRIGDLLEFFCVAVAATPSEADKNEGESSAVS